MMHHECGAPLIPNRGRCYLCGGHVLTAGGPTGTVKLVPLSEVKSAGEERVKIGGGWDRALSGGKGLPLQKEIIITGGPGAGKSTILQQVLPKYLMAMPERYGYYMSFEQSPDEVRATFETVLGHVPDRLLVPDTFGGGATIDAATLAKYPPGFIVVDSVSRACGKDLDAAVAMVQYFKTKVAVAARCLVALVFHMNKQDDVSGKLGAIHDADVFAAMGPWSRGDPVQFQHPDYRGLFADKNRCGPAHEMAWFRMTGKDGRPYHGLEEVPESVAEDKSKRRGLPGSVLELADLKEEMKAEMSDWRARIAAAEKRLAAQAAEGVKDEAKPARKKARKPPQKEARR